jgi:hypothetical protein
LAEKLPSVIMTGVESRYFLRINGHPQGDWKRAHESAQRDESPEGSLAYLHRKEGYQGNAAYWYGRAGKPVCPEPLDAEWLSIVGDLLG